MSTNQQGSIVGLTGGIATGKSTVSQFFDELGVKTIDADHLARLVVEPGQPALAELVDAFGEAILDDAGRLDRTELGAIIFRDDQARDAVNAITHPRIAEAMFDRAQRAFEAGHRWVIYDAALLVETNTHRLLEALIVVDCTEETQLRRLRDRDDLSEEQARQRIQSQMPLAEKRRAADFLIDNNGTLDETRRQVQQVKERIDTLIDNHGTAKPT